MKPAFVALTAAGSSLARRGAVVVGGEVHVLEGVRDARFAPGEKVDAKAFSDTATHLRSLFAAGQPIIGICAAGILIRILAPLLSDKRDEPPVIAMSEDGTSIVPLLGGHRGANELARKLAGALGGRAAITTAGDNRFGVALDAPPPGWTLANPENAKRVMAALLGGARARLEGNADWLSSSRVPFAEDGAVKLMATTRSLAGDDLTLVYHPRKLAVGVGCERGVEAEEAIALVEETLRDAGLAREAVALVSSIDLKADEPAILETAEHLGVPARFFTAAALEAEAPRLRNPSETVFREVGCHGVAEGAALASVGAEGTLVVAKRKSSRVTCAVTEALEIIDVARIGRARGRLAIVGIGPGSPDWLTPEAKRLLETSDAAIGYSLYLDLVAPLITRAGRVDSALGSEEARARRALELAGEGRNVALVSSGDAGIYAMASLVFELLDEGARPEIPPPSQMGEGDHAKHGGGGGHERRDLLSPPPPPQPVLGPAEGQTRGAVPLPRFAGEEPLPAGAYRAEIVVAPGVSAMQAAAARAGAPLGHDFCAISLSDLLTPWETIEARIRAAAEGDFIIAFYNPVSERRRAQLQTAKQILLEHRSADTPILLARNLGRDGESVRTIRLADLATEDVDMLTLVLVGSSTTRQVKAGGQTYAYTPRGYAKKRGPSPPLRGRDGEGGKTPRRALGASPRPGPPPHLATPERSPGFAKARGGGESRCGGRWVIGGRWMRGRSGG